MWHDPIKAKRPAPADHACVPSSQDPSLGIAPITINYNVITTRTAVFWRGCSDYSTFEACDTVGAAKYDSFYLCIRTQRFL